MPLNLAVHKEGGGSTCSANSSHVRYEVGAARGSGRAGPWRHITCTCTIMYGTMHMYLCTVWHRAWHAWYGTYTVRARDVSDFWELLPQIIVAMRPLLYKVAASAETSDVTLNRKPRLVSIKCLTTLTQ